MSKNEYFKRTKKKLVGSLAVARELHKKFTHCMLKLDGTHAELIIDNDVRFITRDGNDVSHLVPYLVSSFANWKHREAYRGVYACELVHIDKTLNDPKDCLSASRRVLGCKEFNQNEPELQCVIYDVHQREYHDVPQTDYLARRLLLPTYHCDEGHIVNKCFDLDNIYTPTILKLDEIDMKQVWQYSIVEKQREGYIVFNADKAVEWDKTFTKVKPLMDVDCIVMDFVEGSVNTKNEGKVGSIRVGLIHPKKGLTAIGKVPHMKEHERDYWTRIWIEGLVHNQVIQVECSEITKAFKLRFPNYVTIREDKTPDECEWEQIL